MENDLDKLPILLYDSECELCTRFKTALELFDTKKYINCVPLQNESIYLKYPFLDKKACEDKIHLFDESLNVYQGSAVIEFLIKLIPGVSKIAWLIEKDSSQKALELFYNTVDQLRKKAPGCRSCQKNSKRKMP